METKYVTLKLTRKQAEALRQIATEGMCDMDARGDDAPDAEDDPKAAAAALDKLQAAIAGMEMPGEET
jgi:hypothetical protein